MEKIKNFFITNKKWFLGSSVFFFLSLSFFFRNCSTLKYAFSLIGILITCVSFFLLPPQEALYILLFYLPFRSFATVFRWLASFFVMFFASLRIIWKAKPASSSLYFLACSAFLVLLESCSDLFRGNFASFAYVIASLFFFVLYINCFALPNLKDLKNALKLICFLSLLLYIISDFDSLLRFAFRSSYRFGVDSPLGSMDVPIYSILLLTICANDLLFSKTNGFSFIANFILCVFGLLSGALSLSKSFLFLASISFIVYLFFSLVSKQKKYKILMVSCILFGLLFFALFHTKIQSLVESLLSRFSDNSLSNRSGIWSSIFSYFGRHPIYLLFGLGEGSYSSIGYSDFYMFYATAHSLYLDSFLAWGILGSFCFFIVYREFLMKIKFSFTAPLIFDLPLIVWLISGLSEGSFSTPNIYIFLLCLPLISIFYQRENNVSAFQRSGKEANFFQSEII